MTKEPLLPDDFESGVSSGDAIIVEDLDQGEPQSQEVAEDHTHEGEAEDTNVWKDVSIPDHDYQDS